MSTEHALPGQQELPLPDSPALVCQRPDWGHRAYRSAKGTSYCERCGTPVYEDGKPIETSSNTPPALATRPNKA